MTFGQEQYMYIRRKNISLPYSNSIEHASIGVYSTVAVFVLEGTISTLCARDGWKQGLNVQCFNI